MLDIKAISGSIPKKNEYIIREPPNKQYRYKSQA